MGRAGPGSLPAGAGAALPLGDAAGARTTHRACMPQGSVPVRATPFGTGPVFSGSGLTTDRSRLA